MRMCNCDCLEYNYNITALILNENELSSQNSFDSMKYLAKYLKGSVTIEK